METLATMFLRTAREDPAAVALRTPGGALEITWRDYERRTAGLASALWARGVRRGDTVALMLLNRPEFNIADVAALLLGATPFSIYNTLAANQIVHLLHNSGTRVVICERAFRDKIEQARAGTRVEHVICADELEQSGQAGFDVDASAAAVEPADLATLIYTSGTTGPPKGVEITHAAILAMLRAGHAVIPFVPHGRVISYLPSAHAADRFFSHYVALATGSSVTCVLDARSVTDAVKEVRPTSWSAVPRIWEKLKAALEAQLDAESDPERKAAMAWALDVGRRRVHAEQAAMRGAGHGPDAELLADHARAEAVALAPLRAALGLDAADWTMSGAAPIAPETLEFFLALGIPVAELWGMSEMFAGTINPPGRMKLGTVGLPLPGVEVRLADDGELLVRSPCMMRGYRGEPEKTAETIDGDGWLHTGDIATIDDDGYVRIVDRKKELIINAGGKNMSPVNIENTIRAECRLVAQAVAIGDRRPYNVALLTLDREALAGRSPADRSVLVAIDDGMRRANARLARVEQIKRFRILPEEWFAGGDEVTPTMKLRRKAIAEKYAAEIDALYAR